MTDPQKLTVSWAGPYAPPVVQLADQELPAGRRVTIDCEPGKPPSVFVEYDTVPPELLEMTGVVHIVREIPADPLAAIQEFLDALDPAELQRGTMAEMEAGCETFGEGALSILRKWARGD